MNDRFYVSSVHGYSGSGAGGGNHERWLWYVFDKAPPRMSRFVGFGDKAREEAEQLARQLNEEYGQ